MAQDARQDEEAATQRRARILGMQYADTSDPNKQLFRGLLKNDQMYSWRVVPLRVDQSQILFGITTTTPKQAMTDLVNQFLDQKVDFAIISDTGFREYMKLFDPPPKVEYKDIDVNTANSSELVQQISAMLEQVRADDMLAYLVAQAHRLNASDIHMENTGDGVRIRFRIDGVLHPVARLDADKYRILLGAVASAANVSTVSDETQQGHISQRVRMADGQEVDINVRLETVNTINGMDVVMRLFNMNQSMYSLDRLNLSPQERQIVDSIIQKPSGLVMVVGPTGSGKTTTLYSMLNTLNSEERKIITIEDPVEYQFNGITQIPAVTREGHSEDFANKLRSVLRLDPDIVMVGEIRDGDTAQTALQAALTGHLVLSTFHANSAAAALTRLADIIQQNPLFISAIRLVMAQRLVRRLDDKSKQPYDPRPYEAAILKKVIDSLPSGIDRPNLEGLKLYAPGKTAENPFGFAGQLPIREQFTMDGAMRELLQSKQGNITVQQIEQAAAQSGMRTMLQDGVLKACAGETTLNEVFRVVG